VLERVPARFSNLPEHIRVFGPEERLGSYALVEMSKAATVHHMTAGLKAALRSIAVAISALAGFRGRGYTMDVESPRQYLD